MNFINSNIEDSDIILQPRPKLHTAKKLMKDPTNFQENKYRAGVLVGYWFERRSEYKPVFNEWITTYKSVYKPHNSENFTNDKTIIWDRKIDDEGLGATITGYYDEKYLQNMSSTYDIFHRIMAQNSPQFRTLKLKKNGWFPQQDLLHSFGNATEFGLIKNKQHKTMMELQNPTRPWDTIYELSFSKHQNFRNSLEKRYLKPRANLNEVDLNHLGIDINKRCFCPITNKL